MEDDDFTHPGLKMHRDSKGLTILLPVKAQLYRRILHLVWFAAWMAGEGLLLASLLGWRPIPPPPMPLLIAFQAAFTVAGGFVLYRLLWYLAGREHFVVTRDGIVAKREIWGIGRTQRFDRRKIRRIQGRRLDYELVYPSWGRMFIGHGDGEILIEAEDESQAYGKGLEEEEARMLAGLMQQEMIGRTQERRPSEIRAG